MVVLPELCDDGNTKAGDGCSDTCKIELGFKCSGSPSQCTPTTCGDKKVEGAESCDDGNALPFDGCSATCQNEPVCTTGACTSKCGDGIVVHEDCDDGNNVDGDGCSADCKVEPGYTCKQPALGDKLLVPAIFRDFRAKMPADFEPGATGRTMALTGIVKPDLDADGKPVYTGAVTGSYITSATTFAEWYRDTPNVNHSTAGTLTLWSNGKGAYVNRYGANGEQWPVTTTAYYCGNVGEEQPDPVTGLAIPCTSRFGTTDCDKYAAMAGYKMVACTVERRELPRHVPDRRARRHAGVLPGGRRHLHARRPSAAPRRWRRPYDANFSSRGGGAEAQLQLHQRGPLLVPVRRDEDVHAGLHRR